jgi:hypothetical protein
LQTTGYLKNKEEKIMQNLEAILSISGTAIGLLVTTVTFLMKFLKSAKAKKTAQNIIDISNAILPYIKKAEAFVSYSGAEKKEYVMTKANRYAVEKGIPFDECLINAKIEELVKLTKEVNKREQDCQNGDGCACKELELLKAHGQMPFDDENSAI